jgi:phospholipid/cholesterol/gamma-HCH transport system substrate-binding protein
MRPSRIGYFVVGLFVLVMVTGLIGLLTVLAGRGEATETYFTRYDNVAGLKFGTPVFYEGFQAGQVEAIDPEETPKGTSFRVEFSVLAELRIPVDSEVQITQPNLLAGRALSIAAGHKEAFVEPGGEIQAGETTGLAALGGLVGGGQQLISEAHELIYQATAAVAQINTWVTDDLRPIADEYKALPTTLRNEVTGLIGELRTTVASANDVVARANLFLSDENAEAVTLTFANVAKLSAELSETSKELAAVGRDARIVLGQVREMVADNRSDVDGTIVDLRYTMETIASRIDSVTYNLEGTSRNMYEFSRQIRLNPGLLIGGTAQTETAGSGSER